MEFNESVESQRQHFAAMFTNRENCSAKADGHWGVRERALPGDRIWSRQHFVVSRRHQSRSCENAEDHFDRNHTDYWHCVQTEQQKRANVCLLWFRCRRLQFTEQRQRTENGTGQNGGRYAMQCTANRTEQQWNAFYGWPRWCKYRFDPLSLHKNDNNILFFFSNVAGCLLLHDRRSGSVLCARRWKIDYPMVPFAFADHFEANKKCDVIAKVSGSVIWTLRT